MKRRLFGLVAAGSTLLTSVLGAGTALATTAPAAALASVTLTPIDSTSTCRYLNPSSAPASTWNQLGFQDTAWPAGQMAFGHEEPSTRTDVGLPQQTVYFRCGFSYDATTQTADSVTLTARVDDGAVLALNGREVARPNMPTGTITHATSATTVDNWDGQRVQTWAVSPSLLRQGWNVITAEVHQAATPTWRSSDLTFDAGLTITATPKPTGPRWNLAFSDEFDGSAVASSNWKPYYNTYGDGDASLHCHTPDNVAVSSGTLKITAKKQTVTCPGGSVRNYTSGFLGSRDVGRYYPLYGRFEVRARIPHGQGMHSGFWLRHRNGASAAEVDVAEFFHASYPGSVLQTLHFPTSLGYNVSKKRSTVEAAVPGRGGWHTYSVDILPVTPGDNSKVTFTLAVDGVVSHSYTNTNASAWTGTDPKATWDMALQLNVGGKWVGHPDEKLGYLPANGGICAQTWKAPSGGNPSACPTNGIWLAPWQDPVFEVDYVRMYTPA